MALSLSEKTVKSKVEFQNKTSRKTTESDPSITTPKLHAITIVQEDPTCPKFMGEGSTTDVYEFLQNVKEVISKSKLTSHQDKINALSILSVTDSLPGAKNNQWRIFHTLQVVSEDARNVQNSLRARP